MSAVKLGMKLGEEGEKGEDMQLELNLEFTQAEVVTSKSVLNWTV